MRGIPRKLGQRWNPRRTSVDLHQSQVGLRGHGLSSMYRIQDALIGPATMAVLVPTLGSHPDDSGPTGRLRRGHPWRYPSPCL